MILWYCNKYSGKCSCHHVTSEFYHMTCEALPSPTGIPFSSVHFFRSSQGLENSSKEVVLWYTVSRRSWTFIFLLLQPLLIGNPLFLQFKAQEKIKWGPSAKRLNYLSLDFHQYESGGTSSESVFPFSFGLFPVHQEPECFLVQIVASPCHLAGCTHTGGKWYYLSGSKRNIYWNSFMEKKRGKKRVQEGHFVQMAKAWAREEHFLGQRWASLSRTQWLFT